MRFIMGKTAALVVTAGIALFPANLSAGQGVPIGARSSGIIQACGDTAHPAQHLAATLRMALFDRKDVQFTVTKVKSMHGPSAAKTGGGSGSTRCVFHVTGTMRARNIHGELGVYAVVAEIAHVPSILESTIIGFDIDPIKALGMQQALRHK